MKTLYIIIFIQMYFASALFSQFPDNVKYIEHKTNKKIEYQADLSDGILMDDLSWASRSSVACFPGTQNLKFRGNHVLFATKLTPYSILKIKAIPANKNTNISLYAYQIGENNYTSIVPNLTQCLTCEADYKWDYPKKGKSQDHTRSVELNSIDNSYNIIIGVAGADGVVNGKFTLEIFLESTEIDDSEQQAVVVNTFDCHKGKTTTIKGNLKNGVKIPDLSWAWKSSVACFPGTQSSKFNGNHVVYSTTMPANSEMEITVSPENKKDNLSIYAYQIGVNKNDIVPNLSSCVACEAEHKWDYPKRGKTQDHTRTVMLNSMNEPYKVIIGIAGADKLSKADFSLKITVK